MCTTSKCFIFLVISCVGIICCSTQTPEDNETRTETSTGNTNQTEDSDYSNRSPKVVSTTVDTHNVTVNPCFSEEHVTEHPIDEELAIFVTRRRKRGYRFPASYDEIGKNYSYDFLLLDDMKRFSDNFLNCSHIGIEPGTFDFFSNGSLYIPRLSMALDKSNFCQNVTTGVVFICDEWIRGNNNEAGSQNEKPQTYDYLSEEFLNCSGYIAIEVGEFETRPNRSVYVSLVDRVFDYSNYLMREDGKLYICSEWIRGNNSDAGSQNEKKKPYDYLSEEFLNCSGHIALDMGEFDTRPNRSVYVPLYDRVFDYSNHLLREDGTLYICSDFFPKVDKFAESFEIVTVVGLSISILFIAAYMISFALLSSLRNLPGYCLFSLCLSLQTAYICFLVRSVGLSQQVCEDLVLSIMYLFLAAFFWMNVLAFDVWRSLKMATSKLRLSSDSMMWKRFALYSAYAWLCPLCIVIFGIIFTKYGSSVKFLKIEFHPELCWFARKGALFVYMALPLIILMCLNVIFFSTSFIMITRASMTTTDNMATFWKRFFLFLRLGVIMGVAWIFGIIAAATNEPALFYIFVILNTLQGVFIFCSFTLNEKTRKEWNKKIRMRKNSVGRTQITSQQVQSMTTL